MKKAAKISHILNEQELLSGEISKNRETNEAKQTEFSENKNNKKVDVSVDLNLTRAFVVIAMFLFMFIGPAYLSVNKDEALAQIRGRDAFQSSIVDVTPTQGTVAGISTDSSSRDLSIISTFLLIGGGATLMTATLISSQNKTKK